MFGGLLRAHQQNPAARPPTPATQPRGAAAQPGLAAGGASGDRQRHAGHRGQKGPWGIPPILKHPFIAPLPRGVNRRPTQCGGRGRRTCATHRGCHGDPPALCHPLTAQTAPWLQLGFSRGFLLLLIRESEAEGPWSFIIHFASEAQGDCSPSPGALSVCLVPLCPAQGKVPLPTRLCCGTAQHLREGERDQVMAT